MPCFSLFFQPPNILGYKYNRQPNNDKKTKINQLSIQIENQDMIRNNKQFNYSEFRLIYSSIFIVHVVGWLKDLQKNRPEYINERKKRFWKKEKYILEGKDSTC